MIAEPDGEEAKHKRSDCVERREEPLAIAGEGECLQTERRKRGVAPEHPDHEKLAETRTRPHATIGPGERSKKTDNERATDVYQQSARGKCLAEFLRNRTREPETAHRPKRTTNCHHQIAEHEKIPDASTRIRSHQR